MALVFSRDDANKLAYERKIKQRQDRARISHLPSSFGESSIGQHAILMHSRVKQLEMTVETLCKHVGIDAMSAFPREQTALFVNDDEEAPKDENDVYAVPECLKSQEYRFMEDTAIAISFAGFMLGISFVLRGPLNTIPDADDDAGQAIGYTVLWVIIGFALLTLSMYVQQRFLLPEKYMYKGKNRALACVEFGQFIAAGLIVGACVSGDGGDSWADDFAITAIYYGLNTLSLIVLGSLYQAITKYDDVEHLAHGNVAAGISYGLTLISYGIILSNPVQKDDSLLAWIAFTGCGVVYLHVVRFLVDKLVLVGSDLDLEIARDVNWGAALIEGVVNIVSALCLTTFLRKSTLDLLRGVCK
jgi:uncharacterized membrane protein YjfL (UPF0719 family)